MGKWLVKIGLKIQNLWCRFQCSWNWLLSKLSFNVNDCPYKMCECKKYMRRTQLTRNSGPRQSRGLGDSIEKLTSSYWNKESGRHSK